jgi:hypothetical protein
MPLLHTYVRFQPPSVKSENTRIASPPKALEPSQADIVVREEAALVTFQIGAGEASFRVRSQQPWIMMSCLRGRNKWNDRFVASWLA